jgi:GPH family glycoside/pentoside/hexuronide:cation symporter
MFREESIRRKSSAIIRFFGNAGVIVSGAILIPFIIRYGDRASFVRFGFIVLIVVVICVLLALPGIKENETVIARYMEGFEERKKLKFWNVLKAGFKSKNFIVFLFALTMATIASNLFQVNAIFFVRYVLKEDVQVMSYILLAYLIGGFLAIPLWFKLAKKYGTEKIWQYGLLLFGLIFFGGLIITTLLQMILWWFLVGFCFAAYLTTFVAVMSDTYDEVTLECGCHQEATLFGVANFFARFSYLVLGVIIAGVHIVTGFVPEAETQSSSAVWGIRLIGGFFPAVFPILAFIAITLWYDLKGEKKETLKAKLKEKGL